MKDKVFNSFITILAYVLGMINISVCIYEFGLLGLLILLFFSFSVLLPFWITAILYLIFERSFIMILFAIIATPFIIKYMQVLNKKRSKCV